MLRLHLQAALHDACAGPCTASLHELSTVPKTDR